MEKEEEIEETFHLEGVFSAQFYYHREMPL